MTKVVGVRFRQVGKIYFFAPGKYSVETGQHVIVETARGVEYGQVVLGEREVEDTAVIQPLKAIICCKPDILPICCSAVYLPTVFLTGTLTLRWKNTPIGMLLLPLSWPLLLSS